MTDPFIFNIVFISTLAYQMASGANNYLNLSEPQDLQYSTSVEVKEIENTDVAPINIDELCAIGKKETFI